MRNRLLQSVFCLFLANLSSTAFALSPPWYLLQAQMKAVLQGDDCVKVGNLTGKGREMKIPVTVCDYKKALALAGFIAKPHEFGSNILVTIEVTAGSTPVPTQAPRSDKEAFSMLSEALDGSRYFVKAGYVHDQTFVEFSPTVIQYFSDDISDWYGMTNLTTAEAFKQVFDLNALAKAGVKVYATTSVIK